MTIVVKKAGQKPEIREVNNELSVFQEIVGGYIECIQITDSPFNKLYNVLCVCDEEGKLKGKRINFIFNREPIVGDVFFCAAGEEDFESLNNEQIKSIITLFNC